MSNSRRKFLQGGAIFAVCAATPAALVRIVGASTGPQKLRKGLAGDPLLYFNHATFAPYVNSIFRIQLGSTEVDLTLVSTKDLKASVKPAAPVSMRESFSLLFFGADPLPRLADGTFVLEHAALGKFPLFLVPVGRSNAGQHYEAIITRF